MNLPNLISLSRVPALFIVAGLLYTSWVGAVSVAFIVYVLGAFTDVLDGYLARKQGAVSDFGKLIDAVTDKIFVLGHFIVLLSMDIMPSWTVFLVIIILGRELLVTGLRSVAAAKGIIVSAVQSGKTKAFTQFFTIGSFIIYRSTQVDYVNIVGPGMEPFAFYFSLACLFVALYYTVYSGIEFTVRNWNSIMGEAG